MADMRPSKMCRYWILDFRNYECPARNIPQRRSISTTFSPPHFFSFRTLSTLGKPLSSILHKAAPILERRSLIFILYKVKPLRATTLELYTA